MGLKKIIKSRKFIKIIIIVLTVFLIAHAYRFFRTNLNYDYLAEYYSSNTNVIFHRIELGRFVSPLFYFIRGRINAPWIVGIFGFLYICLSTYFVINFYDRKQNIELVIISAFMSVNITLSVLISTFLHDFDTDMFALLMAVLAAYKWKNNSKPLDYLNMIPFLIISMGLYQSYASACFILIYTYTMLQFLSKGCSKESLIKLLYGFIVIIISMLLYFGIANVVCYLTNIPLESRINAFELFTKSVGNNILNTYLHWAQTLFAIYSVYGKHFNYILGLLIVTSFAISFILTIVNRKISFLTKFVLIIMFLLLPFASNYTEFLSGSYHTLVMFYPTVAFILPFMYIFVVESNNINENEAKKLKSICEHSLKVLLLIYLYCSIITSNTIYVKKETEVNSTFAYMNRIVYAIESNDEYQSGITPVAILGGHKIIGLQDGYDNILYISGARTRSALGSTYKCYYDAYFEYVIKNDINIVDDETLKELALKQQIIDMPCYPEKGSIAYYNGVLVVKLGESFF